MSSCILLAVSLCIIVVASCCSNVYADGNYEEIAAGGVKIVDSVGLTAEIDSTKSNPDIYVLVLFFSRKCIFSSLVWPAFSAISKAVPSIDLVAVHVDDINEPGLNMRYGVTYTPRIVLFGDGGIMKFYNSGHESTKPPGDSSCLLGSCEGTTVHTTEYTVYAVTSTSSMSTTAIPATEDAVTASATPTAPSAAPTVMLEKTEDAAAKNVESMVNAAELCAVLISDDVTADAKDVALHTYMCTEFINICRFVYINAGLNLTSEVCDPGPYMPFEEVPPVEVAEDFTLKLAIGFFVIQALSWMWKLRSWIPTRRNDHSKMD